ncbi:Rieske (2Fe-2S) protein [Pseudovibrio sp. SPO723]|uniref:Rieske (2Fe-2S) protein n=1 Tax=Nesiotobacter zosterae TaxID=392721 RepID=UPI0029C20FD8|nr:Rieske (2Fe-2S) protein [Pseudovibrio sp. SPO723]MDX5592408.1 Rieske (2Fe-2S) protein [Pseudovibrio sp. SPO723]
MSHKYIPVIWNRTKIVYDIVAVACIAAYLGVYLYVAPLFQTVTLPIDALIYRAQAYGTCVFFLLTVILCIGPLARLDTRFLPLLYNRRHLGVMTACLAVVHVKYILDWYYAFSPTDRYVAVLAANTSYFQFLGFPFEVLGLAALLILLVLATTSHDFWLHFLGPPLWKTLHMGIYFAYALVVFHVALGALQSAAGPVMPLVVGASASLVITLHVLAARKERSTENDVPLETDDTPWVVVGDPMQIPNKRAQIVALKEDERVAVFRDGDKVSAISNVCAHQNGPLGEGKIVYGCVTCPWHGYQYRVEDGCSPPPFTEKVPTYRLKLKGNLLLLDPIALPAGTYIEPVVVGGVHAAEKA